MGVRQLLIFFVLFLEKLHGKAGSLGGVGDMGPHVPHHGAVSPDLVCFYFFFISDMFDSGHGCTQSFPCFFNWRPTPSMHCSVPGGQSRVVAAVHHGVPA